MNGVSLLSAPLDTCYLHIVFSYLARDLTLSCSSIHHQRENIDGRPPGGAEAKGPGAPTVNVKTSTARPREVPKLKVRERPPST
jgi:hypothetical protein